MISRCPTWSHSATDWCLSVHPCYLLSPFSVHLVHRQLQKMCLHSLLSQDITWPWPCLCLKDPNEHNWKVQCQRSFALFQSFFNCPFNAVLFFWCFLSNSAWNATVTHECAGLFFSFPSQVALFSNLVQLHGVKHFASDSFQVVSIWYRYDFIKNCLSRAQLFCNF